MKKKYYIGIDMGTDSVGWAATDEDYRLLKARGGNLWGSYLFTEAAGAADRRGYRTARRRTARRRQRLLLLQSLFAREIEKVDPLFFIRLNNSSFFAEDKDGRLKTDDSLFADESLSDKRYFAEYPTIYHLRASLTDGRPTDVRLLYLAVHHIIKNRGHFLFEGQTFTAGDEQTVRGKFEETNAFLSERELATFDLQRLDDAIRVLRDRQCSMKDRQNSLKDILSVGKDKSLSAAVRAVTGGKVNLKELYGVGDEIGDVKSFSFADGKFDENVLPALEIALGEDDIQLILSLKSIYDWSVLCGIMGDNKFISKAKIAVYDKHRADLKWLKEYVRAHCPDRYAEVFRHAADRDNYAAYIGMDRHKGYKKCSQEAFYAFLKKVVNITDEKVLGEMAEGNFMPKQVSASNGVIPYQVQLAELKAILNNAVTYFPFLAEDDGDGTVSEKIIALMTFRIPYYVGPLHTASPTTFAVRKPGYECVGITPWNFKKAIDLDASEERFIKSMTAKCTYLPSEDVLPASSLLYSKFTFLNELNNLRINGKKDDAARKIIYENAFGCKKVTLKKCREWLVNRGLLQAGCKIEEVFSGIDGDFKTSLSPWCDLAFLGDKLYTCTEMCEQIITWITLISDKDRLEKRIRARYGDVLSDSEIKRLKGLNYAKWGRLSEKFLSGIVSPRCADENGELMTVIEAMEKTGENLMQLLAEKYGFGDAVEEYNRQNCPSDKVTYRTVDDLYCSPAVKRAIWRTVELVREITKICGGAPQKIFIETAREKRDDSRKGRRTVSRRQQLLELYKSIKDEERAWIKEIEDQPEARFNSDKLVLYYRQLGRSMYSGRPIPLEQVFDKNICDIDHIYPRSKLKDDSLDNRVLVFKTENLAKKDEYPVSREVREKMTSFWASLLQKGLISQKKYARLVRNTPLTQEELADFINRQLVSTRQSTKAAAQILKMMLPQTEIVYSKAALANEFKDKFEIIKVRELNDLHHAKDAYVNIVAGNVYNTKFNHNAAVFFRDNAVDSYNLTKLYDRDIPGAWRTGDIAGIKATLSRNDCKVVRMTESAHGGLFDVQPCAAGSKNGLIPLKERSPYNDVAKYGGYNNASTAYFLLVKSLDKNGNVLISLEAYPLLFEKQSGGSAERKIRFLKDDQKLIEPQILVDNIKINTLVNINGSYAWLRGKTNERIILCNANQLYLDEDNVKRLKAVCNYMRDRKELKRSDLPAGEKVTREDNVLLYDALLGKLNSPIYAGLSVKSQCSVLGKGRDKFISLSVEDQCVALFETLRLMQCNSVTADLKLLGGAGHAGVNAIKKFVQGVKFKIIYQSPTGYYRRIIDIKDCI